MADKFSYDVFLVSALEDADFAEMVTRRLRALKMKVWFDKKRDSRTFDSKDAKNVEKSRSLLVLWSKAADESDWVHAAARTGRSRDNLIQTAIDDVVPRDPFHLDERIDLSGLTARKVVPGYTALADKLGAAQGRKGLGEFVGLAAGDREGWLKKHKGDPMAAAAVPAAAVAGGLYMSEMRKREAEWAAWHPSKASGLPAGVPDNLALVGGIADDSAEKLAAAGVGSLTALSMLPDDRHEELETALNLRKGRIRREEWVEQARELLEGLPPRAKSDLPLWTRSQEEHAAALAAMAPVAPVAAMSVPESKDYIKVGILTAILSAIAVMFFLGWLFGKEERQHVASGANACPIGQYPVSLDKPLH